MAFTFAEGIAIISAKADGFMAEVNKSNKTMKNFEKKTDDSLKKTEKSFAKFGSNVKKVFVGMVGLFAFRELIRGVKGAVDEFAEFEQSIKNAGSVASFTAEEFEKVSEAAKEMSIDSTKSAKEIGDGFYFVASAGFAAQQQIDAMQGIVALSEATMADMATTTSIVTSTLSQFGLKASDATMVADVFAKAITKSQANIEKLGLALPIVGSLAASMNWDLQQTVTILSKMFDAGIRAGTAGAGLRTAIAMLSAATGEAKTILKSYVGEIDLSNVSFEEFTGIIETLREKSVTAKDAFKIFGNEAGTAMLTLIGQTGGIKKMNDALDDAGGTAKRVAEDQMSTLSGQLKVLNNRWVNLKITLTELVVPALKNTIPHLQKLVDLIKEGVKLSGASQEEIDRLNKINALRAGINHIIGKIKDNEKDLEKARRENRSKELNYWGKDRKKVIDDASNKILEIIAAEEKYRKGIEANERAIEKLKRVYVGDYIEGLDLSIKKNEEFAKSTNDIITTIPELTDDAFKAMLASTEVYYSKWDGLIEGTRDTYIKSLRTMLDSQKLTNEQREALLLKIFLLEKDKLIEMEKLNEESNKKRKAFEAELLSESQQAYQEYLDDLKKSYEEAWGSLSTSTEKATTGISSWIESLRGMFAEGTGLASEKFDEFFKGVEAGFKNIKIKASGAMAALGIIIGKGIKTISKGWSRAWMIMENGLSDTFLNMFKTGQSFSTSLSKTWEGMKDNFKSMLADMLAEFVSTIAKMLVQAAILGAINMMTGGAGGFVGGFLGGFFEKGGYTSDHRSLPHAQDGLVTGGSGPIPAILHPEEIVMPLDYVRNLFGDMAERFFSHQGLNFSGQVTPKKSFESGVTINVYSPTNFDDIIHEIKTRNTEITYALNTGRMQHG